MRDTAFNRERYATASQSGGDNQVGVVEYELAQGVS